MVEAGTGRTPPALFEIDPSDPNTLVYRPRMAFDSAGNPIFGMLEDRTYFLRLPGLDQDPLGPFVTSVDGEPNQTRLFCVLETTLGVEDPAPGPPRAKLFVQVVVERDPVTGAPTRLERVQAQGAVDVFLQSPIEIQFGDLMNPATLANPVTGLSSFVQVRFDPDGVLQDPSDQVSVPGLFQLSFDQTRGTTLAVFQAQNGLPPSGSQRPPGRMLVILSPLIQDLAGNRLVNPGGTSFVTESR